MPEPTDNLAVIALELALLLAGLVLLWRLVFSPTARTTPAVSRLSGWLIATPDFFLILLVIICGVLALTALAGLVLRPFHLSIDRQTILVSAAFQLGLLVGPALLPLQLGHHPLRPSLDRATLRSGIVTFLVALPVVTLVSALWLGLLHLCGFTATPQDALELFLHAKPPVFLFVLIGLAVFIAPVGEELLFRATLFRFLRTRLPRWIALVLPALIFAAFHQNLAAFAPLAALAIVFSLAYERTGRIGTTMIAHGLFNLHTIVLVLAGVTS